MGIALNKDRQRGDFRTGGREGNKVEEEVEEVVEGGIIRDS